VSTASHALRRKLPVLIGGGFLLLVTLVMIWLVKGFIASADKPERPRVQQISLVKPPPPKPQEKPPEPEKLEEIKQEREEVQLDQPPMPDQVQDQGPPPGEQLGLDADGSAGSDGFGLAARRGGRDITTLGGGGDREAWYGRVISRHFEESLRRSKRLQGTSYQVIAQVWFDGGVVRRVRLARGSGNPETDAAIEGEIMALPPLREVLPEDLPQPVRVRVASRA
jgi:protein TonB